MYKYVILLAFLANTSFSENISVFDFLIYAKNNDTKALLYDKKATIKCPFFPSSGPKIEQLEEKEFTGQTPRMVSYDIPEKLEDSLEQKKAKFLLVKFFKSINMPDYNKYADKIIKLTSKRIKPVYSLGGVFIKFGYDSFDCHGPDEVTKRFGNLIAEDLYMAKTFRFYKFNKLDAPCLTVMEKARGVHPKTKDDFLAVAYALARFHDRYRTGHGDLDASNVLVVPGTKDVTFIDFDSMVDEGATYSQDLIKLIKEFEPEKDETYLRDNLDILNSYVKFFSDKNDKSYSLTGCYVRIE